MKESDIPYPPPAGFKSGPPKAMDDLNPNEAYHQFPPKGNLEGAGDDVCDSIWNVPQGRRGK